MLARPAMPPEPPDASPPRGRLRDKVALITGAGEGMGRAAALLFAREGAAVAALDLDADRAAAVADEIGDDAAIAVTADVADADAVRAAVAATVERFGRLDVLYNNAGVWLPGDGTVTELDEAAWHRTIAVNLTGVFHCCRFGIPQLIRAGGGSVINTSSPVAVRPEPAYDAYVASKGAVLSLTRAIAQNYARQGVRANVLMPGGVDTAMTRPALADPRYAELVLRNTPLGRIGRPQDVAYAALYLASDESSFVTGSVQWVDGGWLLGPEQETFPPV
jgi:NAD(P)-dependent dehydrogenase (short-subunit alcohol dehydrogenase family)